MRIAVLGNAAALHTRRWAGVLAGRGHEVRIFSLERPPEDGDREAPVTVVASWPLPRALRYPLARNAMMRALRDFDPDLVDAHYVPNYGFLAALVGRHPFVLQCWGSDLLVSAKASALHARRARLALESADLVLADARVLGEAAVHFGAPQERVHVVPWGADLGRFPLAPVVDEPRLVSVRQLEPLYDVGTLIEALPAVCAAVPGVALTIAGDGPERAALEARVGALGLADHVRFVGRVPHTALGELVARSAIYVSTSRSDSTSISLLEAMATGPLPVVSDIPGNREWVGDFVNGRLFPVGDAPALAAALIGALRDPAFRARARATNRARIEADGDWAKNVARIEALYAGLLPPAFAPGNARTAEGGGGACV